jgi:hypothetical protein
MNLLDHHHYSIRKQKLNGKGGERIVSSQKIAGLLFDPEPMEGRPAPL